MGKKKRVGRPRTGEMKQHQIRAWKSQWKTWQRAAKNQGKKPADWIRDTLDNAARHALKD